MKDQVCYTWSCLVPSYTMSYFIIVGTILDREIYSINYTV